VSDIVDPAGLGTPALGDAGLGAARPGSGDFGFARKLAAHRIPLGLLLLSRQQLTAVQLRTALDRQRIAGHGKIGEWLQRLGFATEWQITAALARQWACPVLRNGSGTLGTSRCTPIPVLLLESIQMIPVEFAEASQTLLIAFSEGIDHSVLYAVEQMLGYRTEACFVCPSVMQKGLEALAQIRGSGDIIFDRVEDARECARIVVSYAAKVAAEEIRLVKCGHHLWIRLRQPEREAVNLVLRTSTAQAFA
jgi:Type II secretion system (T2SS), protein E, N-terminal domain